MKGIISDSFGVYLREFTKILVLSLLTYVPLLLVHAFLVNYIYYQTRFAEYPGLIGDAANGIFMLVFLTIGQVPFIRFTLLEMEGEDNPLKSSISFSLDKAIPIYLFGCVYALCVFVGGLFFIIPGLIVLLLFYFVPFFMADGTKSIKMAMGKSTRFVKKNIVKAILMIMILTIIQLSFENIVLYLLSFYTNTYFTMLMTKIILLMLLLPLQTIIMTNAFHKWNTADVPIAANKPFLKI
ncbi:hypothetical protein [Bacillus sp. REN3]|uniref:hypothetical protein n=1 Tax=Bacillus sp. REN3 TaxID=2802440 RepID=UPI001AED21A2|nr:hypothetical protein [Bacillus sp. REN3]